MATAISVDTGSGVPDTTGYEAIYQGEISFSGNYVTGGDTLSFGNGAIISNSVPNRAEIYEQPNIGQTASNYSFVYVPGTTIANGKIQLFAPGGAQLAAGAYPGAIAATVVKFRAWFGRGA